MSLARRVGYGALRALSFPASRAIGRGGLRILAYHDVPDRALFTRQLGHLVRWYAPITDLSQLVETGKPSAWVTFDDGDPTIVDVALDVLREVGVRATAFICPGMIDTEEPFWWQVVHAAARENVSVDGSLIETAEVQRLKEIPDSDRRERVKAIRSSLEDQIQDEFRSRQLTHEDLRRWVDGGNLVGSHTWDHPILNNCTPDEQERQVALADEWFSDRDLNTSLFAYPNGDWAKESEDVLRRLGYEVGLLFDHRIATRVPSLQMSRVRVNGTDSMNEFIAKVSGIHPAVMHWMSG